MMKLNIWYLLRFVVLSRFVPTSATADQPKYDMPWDLPLLPSGFPRAAELSRPLSNGKLIPSKVWIATKTVPDPLPFFLDKFRGINNDTWEFHIADNQAQLAFMEEYYPDTSVLWAYKQIHPLIGNSAADIWRYAVLFRMGGMYMDDDSFIKTHLDHVVHHNDSLIVAREANAYKDDCYKAEYKLSGRFMHSKFNVSMTERDTSKITDLFAGRIIVSWAVFAAPGHPILVRTLANMVDMVRREYLKESAIWMGRWDIRWKYCMCITGPSAFTASIREYLVERWPESLELHPLPKDPWENYTLPFESLIRVVPKDFHHYGGNYKANRRREGEEQHYMSTMHKNHIPILRDYVNDTVLEYIKKREKLQLTSLRNV